MTKRRARRGEALKAFRELIALETNDCVLWPFGIGSHGYGDLCHVFADERKTNTHVASCALAHGDRRRDKAVEVEHVCGVRLCINPRHLRWASSAENNRRKREHGTLLFGERHPIAKLTEKQIIEIRAATGPQWLIAERFGVHQTCISAVRRHQNWRHVK